MLKITPTRTKYSSSPIYVMLLFFLSLKKITIREIFVLKESAGFESSLCNLSNQKSMSEICWKLKEQQISSRIYGMVLECNCSLSTPKNMFEKCWKLQQKQQILILSNLWCGFIFSLFSQFYLCESFRLWSKVLVLEAFRTANYRPGCINRLGSINSLGPLTTDRGASIDWVPSTV